MILSASRRSSKALLKPATRVRNDASRTLWRPGTRQSGRVMAVDIAIKYICAGDKARAIDWLEKAYEDRDPNLPYLGKPVWDSVRDDPAFPGPFAPDGPSAKREVKMGTADHSIRLALLF